MAATTENCTAPCHRSPFLPWLLDKPVDGEGEEVVEEDEDAEAEEQEVDDHLGAASPPSAASLPPPVLLARLCLPGKSRLDWQGPAAEETYTRYTLSIHTHTQTN